MTFIRLTAAFAFVVVSNLSVYANDRPPIFINSTVSADVYVEPPYCNGSDERDLNLRLNFRSLTDALSKETVFRHMDYAVRAMQSDWRQQNYCLFSGNSFTVTSQIDFANQKVASASFTTDGSPRFSDTPRLNSSYNIVNRDIQNTDLGILLDSIKWPTKDDDKTAYNVLKAYEDENPGSFTADINLLLGMSLRMAFQLSNSSERDKAMLDAMNYFAIAGELGSSGGIRKQLDGTSRIGNGRLIETLGDIAVSIEKDGKVSISETQRQAIVSDIELYEEALRHNIAVILNYNDIIMKAGITVTKDMQLEVDPDTIPFAAAIERALNTRLRLAATTSDSVISSLINSSPDFAYACDQDWCSSFGGLVKFRFYSGEDPDCLKLERGLFECSFAFRIVGYVDMQMGDHPGNALLSEILRNSSMQKRARFQMQDNEWVMVGGLQDL